MNLWSEIRLGKKASFYTRCIWSHTTIAFCVHFPIARGTDTQKQISGLQGSEQHQHQPSPLFTAAKCSTLRTQNVRHGRQKKQNFSIILSFNLQLSFFQLSDPPLYRSVLLLTHKAPTDLKWQLDLILLKYCTCKWRSTFLPAFPPDNPTEGAASNLCRNSVLMLGPLTQCSWRLKCKLTRVACTVVTQTTLKMKPYTSHCWHTVFKIENLIKSHFGQSISTANKDSVTGQKQSF